MRLTTVFMIAAIMQVSASGFAQRVTFKAKQGTLQELFKAIKAQTGYNVVMSAEKLEAAQPVSVDFKNEALERVLEVSLEGQNLTYTIDKKTIVIREKEPSFLERLAERWAAIDVRGRVVDSAGNALVGATVKIKGTNRVVITGNNGEFNFKDVDENSVLEISYLGYKMKEVKVAKDLGDIELEVISGELEEVKVTYNTGYQNIPKERATGSFVNIDNKTYNEQVGTNFLSRLPAIANSVNVLSLKNRVNQITVRGQSTFSGPRQPLIVVDNFPYEGDLNNINPNDIESIDILRDAAAASIWGARAGNGVIVVNTKKGRFNEKMKLEVSSNITVIQEPDLFYIKPMATGDFIDIEKFLFDKGLYDFSLDNYAIFFQTQVIDILEKQRKLLIDPNEATRQLNRLRTYDVRRDFENYIYQNGLNQQYAVNFRGGSKTMAWNLSGGMDKNVSELAAEFERYNFRFGNLYKPIDKLQLSFGVVYANTKSKNGKPAYGETLSPNDSTIPYGKFIDDDGLQIPYTIYRRTFVDTIGKGKLLDWKYYPLEDYKHATNTVALQSVVAELGLNYTIIKGLSFDLKYQLEKQSSSVRKLNDRESYYTRDLINYHSSINPSTGAVTRPIPLGSVLNLTNIALTAQNLRLQFNVNQSWGESKINAIAGTEIRDISNENEVNQTYGYDEDLRTAKPVDYILPHQLVHPLFGSGITPFLDAFSSFKNRYVSFFTNMAYTYQDRYIISVSGRQDASNIFGAETNKRWSPLWSAGMAWNISKEDFYKFESIPYLKLRATYGHSGNVSPNLSSVTTIAYGTPSIYTNGQTARISNFKNSDLTWEKVGVLNFGLDFSTKGNVIQGSIEYFRKNAKDLYSSVIVDRTLGLGVATLQKNSANLRGQGVDIILNSNNISGNLKWASNLNLSYYNNKVVKYYNASERADRYLGGGNPHVGYPINSVYTMKWAGLDPVNGDPRGYVNGKVSKNYNAILGDSATIKDLTFHGSATPVLYGSIGNTFQYRNFSLTLNIGYQLGFYFVKESINYSSLFENQRGHVDYAKRWQKPGDEEKTDVPSMAYPANAFRDKFFNFSDPLVRKGDNIRLQYINASYTFDGMKHKRIPFSSLRLFVVANNLGLIWTANKEGLDPLAYYGNVLPPLKNFSIGINAKF